MVRSAPRSNSRLSMTSKAGGGSRASDDESRTAVKVAVRVRPPLNPTDPGFDLIPQRFQRSMVHVTSNTNLAIDSPQGRKLFVFDRVFSPDVGQDGIWEYVSDCVNAFVQGYNVSLLAYGQSGAGKSYTMGTAGPSEQGDLEMKGVIPRAATALFDKLDTSKAAAAKTNRNSMSQLRSPQRFSTHGQAGLGERGWSMKATYVEIYNEQLRDLLVEENVPPNERSPVTIREDVKGNILLTGLRQVDINSIEDLMNALSFGSSIRQTDATAINAKSSRSHAVFSLNLVQRKNGLQPAQGAEKRFSVPIEAMTGSESWVTTDSKLHFVDLAGSERLKNTGAQGERAKEGISINAGLAALGKVISQLSSRQAGSHVSYRDSKLTRLLQDSLGGNAITYMIACVTPAEFHLSETLNTVQYAQRARAIQSKPRIQQVEEGDKQALIDRLKAEVAFLREQIRSADRAGGERRTLATSERSERPNEREVELQNHLLDIQENYTTLSQRHARLIAEMAKARDNEMAENQHLEESLDDSATERLNRSNSFAQAVEQVVLEYEKTIQTLEQSLSSTRTTLSNTEASLLEKESKFAYVETINTQLQARLQKLMDREASTENYLHDLEAKLDGHTSGEEKNATIILELRKEISRVRENEAACEDYISTLEERLAEADQDAELMQREIDRLEQVIERQRSLGKLDSLLYELDHLQQDGRHGDAAPAEVEVTNGIARRRSSIPHSRSQSHVSRHSQKEAVIPEGEEEEEAPQSNGDRAATPAADEEGDDEQRVEDDGSVTDKVSPAQSKFVADKLEAVTQELVDLRVEHESTINEYDSLHSKYEEALRNIADLQDMVDESRHPHRPIRDSVLSVTSPTTTRPDSYMSDSRSTFFGDGIPAIIDNSDAETATAKPESQQSPGDYDDLPAELERLKTLAAEKEAAERELSNKSNTPVIRRKSSQNVMIIDRAHRSFASLKNIAAENFEADPDTMQNFELNLNAAMHELHARSERIQELEADVASARKEMETKMTIISGLTRERSSLQASPRDISVVSAMKNQLELSETQLRAMREAQEAREKELTDEIEALRASLKEEDANETRDLEISRTHAERIEVLESELSGWEDKHKAALDNLKATEEQMQKSIADVEAQLADAQAKLAESEVKASGADASKEMEEKQRELVGSLQAELDEYKLVLDNSTSKISELESVHAATRAELDEAIKARDVASSEAAAHKALVADLEVKIDNLEVAAKSHQEAVQALNAKHAKELEDLKLSEQSGYEEQVAVLMSEHSESINALESELNDAREDLMKVATQVAFALGLPTSVDKITERIEDLIADQKALAEEQKKRAEIEMNVVELSSINDQVMGELETVKKALDEMLGRPAEEKQTNGTSKGVLGRLAVLKKRMDDLDMKNKKHSRLVEELEVQLQQNFDQAQLTSNRLSTLQSERHSQLEEANTARTRAQSELDAVREEYAALQAKFDEINSSSPDPMKRSNSMSSQLRKSSSTGRPMSKDNMAAISQIRDDQEARIRTIEKHLDAEKQLTATLEEALSDLERQSNKVKSDCDAWRKRAQELETELKDIQNRPAPTPQPDNRWSLQAVEEERKKRQAAEAARAHLEERMRDINKKKKKKGSLNCF
ncbi:unnamed protein product [Parascedosporium putredinis]|uniref:Kinesin motor domain-containing protein n=1 Tax=Parascedosporium putredinis TaxID=1442378 RepID=A0A9P1MGR6_9PEZI|nr:unnamed protein product [Parascedosporium putredinis]CAI8004970.1 unnamed protein product [Parascedosporium putredinis]